MPSAKGKLVRLFGNMLLSHAKVVVAEAVSAGFHRIKLQGDVGKPNPGDKLQILLPSDDVRTYTPIAWRDGSVVLLGATLAGGPGAKWLSTLNEGADVSFARAQRSLSLPAGPVILAGDETSVAVAASYELARPSQVQAMFQGASPDAILAAAATVELQSVLAFGAGDTLATVDAIVAAKGRTPNATIALTGGSESILALRTALRERGLRDLKAKAYWIPGKTGLD